MSKMFPRMFAIKRNYFLSLMQYKKYLQWQQYQWFYAMMH